MRKSEFIEISSVSVNDNKLEVNLAFSKKMSKYFHKNSFQIIYDRNIENVDDSILSIPAVLGTIQIAWAVGVDLYVEKLDETCLLNLKALKKAFEAQYPQFSTSSKIHVQKIVSNKFNNKQSAMYFSGGLDSLVTYIRHKDQNPLLITLLQVDESNNLKKSFKEQRNLCQKFAEQEGLDIHFIRSELFSDPYNYVINTPLLSSEFKIKWMSEIASSFIFLGLIAPITVENIGKIILATAYPKDYWPSHNQSMHFFYFNTMSWADINFVYDANMTRQKKIKYLKSTPNYFKNILVCTSPVPINSIYPQNCGICEKCWRTIMGLILEGVDPNECNFDVKNNILDDIKNILNTCPFLFYDRYFFLDIQSHIPDLIKDDKVCQRYNAKEFFKWFRGYEFPEYKKGNLFVNYLKFFYIYIKYKGLIFTIKKTQRYLRKKIQEFSS